MKGRIENLRPWPKGVSGNPGGRPKSKSLSEAYRDRLERIVPDDPEGRTFAEKIAEVLAKKALKGDVQAARELADRAEGKARQSIAFSHDAHEVALENRTDEELDYFARTGLWPTPEQLEYSSANYRFGRP